MVAVIMSLLLSVAGAKSVESWKEKFGPKGITHQGVIIDDFESPSGFSVFNRQCGQVNVPISLVDKDKTKKGDRLAYQFSAGKRCTIESNNAVNAR